MEVVLSGIPVISNTVERMIQHIISQTLEDCMAGIYSASVRTLNHLGGNQPVSQYSELTRYYNDISSYAHY